MQRISKIIRTEEIKRKNLLQTACEDQTNAAIRSGTAIKAVLFVQTIFSTDLIDSKYIVNEVRAGISIIDVKIK